MSSSKKNAELVAGWGMGIIWIDRCNTINTFYSSPHRNIGMGTSTSAARVGSFLSPYIVFSVSSLFLLVRILIQFQSI